MNNSLKEEVYLWNKRFPVDRWWRQKHDVPFNSPTHRESNFLDQLFEYFEDEMYDPQNLKENYIPNNGDWLGKKEVSEEKQQLSLIEEARKELSELPDNFGV